MCNTCCKQFQGWCRAFTATEVLLSILQAVLLALFVALLTFIILHLIACAGHKTNVLHSQPFTEVVSTATTQTVAAGIECTWTPSEKTSTASQYFDDSVTVESTESLSVSEKFVPNVDDVLTADVDERKGCIMALVKMTTPYNITFGCIITIISEFWTVTAASCLESIKKRHSLDSYVMLENIDQLNGSITHRVKKVVTHPQHLNGNGAYGIVALRSEDRLSRGRGRPMKLPTIVDSFLITIGEELTILGFGSVSRRGAGGGVRAVPAHALVGARCGVAVRGGWGAPVCAGQVAVVGGGGGVGCGCCAGGPLVRGAVVVGVRLRGGRCGAAPRPALYVNVAALADWLRFVIERD